MSRCDYLYRDSFCAHGKVPGLRCIGDQECPVKDRKASSLLDRQGWYRHHDKAYPGEWRE